MAISDFQNLGFLSLKIKKWIFSKINSCKTFFWIYPKIGICSLELYSNSQCTKFQANIFIFGRAMAQQPGKGADVTFWNAIVGISNCCTPKQMTLWESWDKTTQDRFVLKRTFWVSKLDIFWVELDLTLG